MNWKKPFILNSEESCERDLRYRESDDIEERRKEYQVDVMERLRVDVCAIEGLSQGKDLPWEFQKVLEYCKYIKEHLNMRYPTLLTRRFREIIYLINKSFKGASLQGFSKYEDLFRTVKTLKCDLVTFCFDNQEDYDTYVKEIYWDDPDMSRDKNRIFELKVWYNETILEGNLPERSKYDEVMGKIEEIRKLYRMNEDSIQEYIEFHDHKISCDGFGLAGEITRLPDLLRAVERIKQNYENRNAQ